jgi:hypothetical protein
MRFIILATAAALMCQPILGPLGAEDPKPSTSAEEYEKLVKAQRAAQEKFSQAYQAAKTDQERQQVLKEHGRASPQSHSGGFLKLIQKHPKDAAALKAFWWLLAYDRGGRATSQAARLVAEHHGRSEDIVSVCRSLSTYPCPAGEKLLRVVLEKNPHRAAQGNARYSLAQCLKNRSDNAAARERDQLGQEAEKLLEQVVGQYPDLKHYSGTLGKAAEAELFELRHLSVGKVAPDIAGEDIDGKPMKLADYRGKVVLLVFWDTL